VVWVANSLDLVDVAVRVSHDDKANISQWMNAGLLAKVNDQQAQEWLEQRPAVGVRRQSIHPGTAGKSCTLQRALIRT
jgi:hypothetical protein